MTDSIIRTHEKLIIYNSHLDQKENPFHTVAMNSSSLFFQSFQIIDYFVFLGVLFLTLLFILWGQSLREKEKTEKNFVDYLIMGRRLTLPLFTATLVATWYGGIFGVTEISYQYGIYNFVTQGVFWYATYLIFAFFLVHKLKSYSALTLPELAGELFGPRSQKVAAVFNFFNVLPIAYVLSIGLFLKVLFGGELLHMTVIGTVIVVLYSTWGGFRSVVFSDLLQFFVMCLAVMLVIFFSLGEFGGFAFLRANLPAGHFELMGGNSLATTLVWGFIALSTLVDPNFYQRCFAAVDEKVARRGIVIATLIWIVFDLCTTFGGMYARAVLPNVDPSQAYLKYALQILPTGLKGFFLAGVLATILSTLDSYLFIASNTLTYDLGPRSVKRNLFYNHLGTFFVAALAIFLSSYFEGSVKSVWKTLGSYSAGCLLIPMMLGFLKPGWVTDKMFLFATLLGALGVTYWRVVEHSGFLSNVDSLYVGLLATSVGLVIGKALLK